MVVKSDGEWWTGYIDGRSGIFPANFVKKVEMPQPVTTQKDTAEVSENLGFPYHNHGTLLKLTDFFVLAAIGTNNWN